MLEFIGYSIGLIVTLLLVAIMVIIAIKMIVCVFEVIDDILGWGLIGAVSLILLFILAVGYVFF